MKNIFALDVDAHEAAIEGGVEHVGDAQTRFVVERRQPQRFKHRARRFVGDMAIARQLVRERTHVAGALDVILSPQRVDPDAGAADIAGRHRQVGDRHYRRGALAVFGDA